MVELCIHECIHVKQRAEQRAHIFFCLARWRSIHNSPTLSRKQPCSLKHACQVLMADGSRNLPPISDRRGLCSRMFHLVHFR